MRVFWGGVGSWGRNVAEVDLGEMRQEGLQGPDSRGLWRTCGGIRTLSHRQLGAMGGHGASWMRAGSQLWLPGGGCVAGVTPGAEDPMRGLRSDDTHPGGQREVMEQSGRT